MRPPPRPLLYIPDLVGTAARSLAFEDRIIVDLRQVIAEDERFAEVALFNRSSDGRFDAELNMGHVRAGVEIRAVEVKVDTDLFQLADQAWERGHEGVDLILLISESGAVVTDGRSGSMFWGYPRKSTLAEAVETIYHRYYKYPRPPEQT